MNTNSWEMVGVPTASSAGILAAMILMVGVVAAFTLRWLIARALGSAGFNRFADQVGVSEFLRKGGVNYTPAKLLAMLGFWVVLGAAFLGALHCLGLRVVAAMGARFEAALPTLIMTAGMGLVGYVCVVFFANVLRTMARNAALPYADPLAKITKWLGVLIVFGVAGEQLGVEFKLISTAFLIAWGAVALGLALAFGLGCKDMARDAMQKFLHNLKQRYKQRGGDLEG
jgi:hypothetical protein